jgi:dolichol-phosphate mannosyltransferase
METLEKTVDINLKQKKKNKQVEISIVIPVFQEGGHITNSVGVIRDILTRNNIRHKFILIDDGSRDNTWQQLENLAYTYNNITALRLSRNFGKEAAICAGLEYVDTSAALIMDSDLQHPPDLIPEMVRLWSEEGYDVVEGVKNTRGKESIFYHLCAATFYKVIHRTSGIDLSNASDFKLLDKKVIDGWKMMPERTTFFRGMSAWVGYSRKQLKFDVGKRVDGKSKWSIIRLTRLALYAITSYTTVPLHFITVLGFVLFFLSIVLGIQTMYMKLSGQALDGFTTVILLQLIIGSCIMISLGIIGIYLTKIYHEVKGRPRYLISKCIKEGDEVC